MFLSLLLLVGLVHAAEPQFTILGENECAPFEGVLFNKEATAELLVLQERVRLNCEATLNYELQRQRTEFDLEISNLNIRLDSLQEEYDLRITEKDLEIVQLQESLLSQSPQNRALWVAGGVAIGILSTYAAYRIFNEQ
jgi:hypothetical protein